MQVFLACLLLVAALPLTIRAQDPHAGHAMAGDTARSQPTMMEMMTGPLGISMAREGSGTSWLPDETPMHALHATAGPWLLMAHGNAFLQYLKEGSDRGSDQLGSINWVMGMARRPLAGGTLTLRAMLSAEASTVGKCGYPDLLATGEFCHGQPLHDRQHPHDLFMELSAGYERAITSGLAFQLYGGPVGEPALGPTAYPHRLSALPNPIAPISHHWLDATHISFGVVTAGLYGRRWKVEGSAFNGREPDEDRYDLNLDRLDSYSGRIWFLPTNRWALQASAGRLVDAEAPRDGGEAKSITRATASATYHRPLGEQSIWANTLAWGSNIEKDHTTHAVLAESNLTLGERDVFFARGEVNGKTGSDLALPTGADPALQEEIFTIGKIAVGYDRQIGSFAGLMPGIGVGASLSIVPRRLEPYYGRTTAPGLAVFFSLRPKPMPPMGMAMDSTKMDHRRMEMMPR